SLAALDDHSINPSRQASLNEVVDRSRRGLLKGGLGLAGVAFLGGGLSASAAFAADSSLMGFESVPVQLDPAFDSVQVPPGYRARVFFSWGDPVEEGAPQWQPGASDDWQAQLLQAGDNHDGMHFFPFPDAPTEHGLL